MLFFQAGGTVLPPLIQEQLQRLSGGAEKRETKERLRVLAAEVRFELRILHVQIIFDFQSLFDVGEVKQHLKAFEDAKSVSQERSAQLTEERVDVKELWSFLRPVFIESRIPDQLPAELKQHFSDFDEILCYEG